VLPVFAGGRLASEEPGLKIRRASQRPQRFGFAAPAQWRVSVTAYPRIRPGDAQETMDGAYAQALEARRVRATVIAGRAGEQLELRPAA